jgi:hypothetical protein
MGETMSSPLAVTLYRIFGMDGFSAYDVASHADRDAELAAAIEATVPRCRYKSGWKEGRFQTKSIEMVLRRSKELNLQQYDHNYYRFWLRANPL